MLKMRFSIAAACLLIAQTAQTQTSVSTKAYKEEWVYRVKHGYQEEWWRLFQRLELAELDAFKNTGEVVDYSVYRPSLHADEAARWDFRIIVTYRDIAATMELRARQKAVIHRLFPDEAAYNAGQRRRWDLTLNHWDLPINEVDAQK